MSLHERIPTPHLAPHWQGTATAEEQVLDDEAVDEDAGECPYEGCGSRSWSAIVYGRYSQRAFYSFGEGVRYTDYDDIETEGIESNDHWDCENGHDASPTITEMLEQVI